MTPPYPVPDEAAGLDAPAGLAEVQEALAHLQGQLLRTRWANPITRGSLPQTEVRDALPGAAAEEFRFQIVTVRGDGTTTPDATYQCLRATDGSYEWVALGSGTA